MEAVINFITNYYEIILAVIGAVEVFVRIKPTDKNYSIIDFVYRLLTGFAPNLAKNNQKFAIAKVNKEPKVPKNPNNGVFATT